MIRLKSELNLLDTMLLSSVILLKSSLNESSAFLFDLMYTKSGLLRCTNTPYLFKIFESIVSFLKKMNTKANYKKLYLLLKNPMRYFTY